jgi:hypothetical protein
LRHFRRHESCSGEILPRPRQALGNAQFDRIAADREQNWLSVVGRIARIAGPRDTMTGRQLRSSGSAARRRAGSPGA